MTTAAGTALSNDGLTVLSEEEELFRSSVREFAEGEVRPRVEAMEHAAKLDPELIKQCSELGLMAIESPEEYGGAGSTIFNAIVAIEELVRVDASVSVFVDVHNTLVTNAFIRWGSDEQRKKYLTQLAEGPVGAYALSEAGSGSKAFPSGRSAPGCPCPPAQKPGKTKPFACRRSGDSPSCWIKLRRLPDDYDFFLLKIDRFVEFVVQACPSASALVDSEAEELRAAYRTANEPVGSVEERV